MLQQEVFAKRLRGKIDVLDHMTSGSGALMHIIMVRVYDEHCMVIMWRHWRRWRQITKHFAMWWLLSFQLTSTRNPVCWCCGGKVNGRALCLTCELLIVLYWKRGAFCGFGWRSRACPWFLVFQFILVIVYCLPCWITLLLLLYIFYVRSCLLLFFSISVPVGCCSFYTFV